MIMAIYRMMDSPLTMIIFYFCLSFCENTPTPPTHPPTHHTIQLNACFQEFNSPAVIVDPGTGDSKGKDGGKDGGKSGSAKGSSKGTTTTTTTTTTAGPNLILTEDVSQKMRSIHFVWPT